MLEPVHMMEELSKKELAEAKRQARRLRIRNIRRRIASGAVMLVALFSGLALYRSIDQQTATATTASVSQSEDSGSSLIGHVTSLFSDDDHEDDDDDDGGGLFSSSSSSSSSPAPLTSSQS